MDGNQSRISELGNISYSFLQSMVKWQAIETPTVYVFSLCTLTIIRAVSFKTKAFHLRMPCLRYLAMVLLSYLFIQGVVFYLCNLEYSSGMRSMP